MVDGTNFDVFGSSQFQNRVLQGLFTDKIFFERIFEILKEEYFTSEAHQIIWREIIKLFNKYNAPPTFDMLRVEIAALPETNDKDDALTLLVDIEKKTNRSEIEHAKEKAFEFCKNQSMKQAILQ